MLKLSDARRELSTAQKLVVLTTIDSLEDDNWVEEQLPQGHLLYRESFRASTEFNRTLLKVCEQELAASERATAYHERQIELYVHALWRPWMRLAEDPSQELSDLLPETQPSPSPTFLPVVPQPRPAVVDQSIERQLQLEISPSLPEMPPKTNRPWQPIERPLPLDFDKREVQVEKATAA